MFSKVLLFASTAQTLHTSAHEAAYESLNYFMQSMIVPGVEPADKPVFDTARFSELLHDNPMSSFLYALENGLKYGENCDSSAVSLDTFLKGRKARVSVQFDDEQPDVQSDHSGVPKCIVCHRHITDSWYAENTQYCGHACNEQDIADCRGEELTADYENSQAVNEPVAVAVAECVAAVAVVTVSDIAAHYQKWTATDVLNALRVQFEAGGLNYNTALPSSMYEWFYIAHPHTDGDAPRSYCMAV